MNAEMQRMTIDLGPEQAKALGSLADAMDMTKAGVIRTAIRLLLIARAEARNGNALVVARDDRVVKELIGEWNQPTAA